MASRCATVLTALIVELSCLMTSVSAQDLTLPQEPLEIITESGTHRFEVEVASTDAQRARGLMERTGLADDYGMLFVFENEGERYFWMKDTPESLDIIFVSGNGMIVRIAERTEPFSEKIIPSRGDARFVLEVKAGTSERLGFGPGDRIMSPTMAAVSQ